MNQQPDDPGPRFGSAYVTALRESSREDIIDEAIQQKARANRAERWNARFMAITLLLAAGVIALTIFQARAETVDGSRIIVIDGDTVALPCATPAPGCSERVRILNIDAPETRGAVCEAERALGYRAKERLAVMLRGRAVSIDRCEEPASPANLPNASRCFDRYGRSLARLSTAEGDIGSRLIAEGLALPWAPGAAAKFERQTKWCGRAEARRG